MKNRTGSRCGAHARRSVVAAACVVAAAANAVAQETAASEETAPTIADLQRQIDEMSERFDKTPSIGSSRATMKVFGRIHIDSWSFLTADPAINVFETGDPDLDPQNNIQFRRARLGVSGDIQDSMQYKIELDFGKTDSLTFKDLYFGFDQVPGAQTILIGNQKRPYGLDHLNSSRYNVFIERPFVVEALNQDARRLGIVAYGTDDEQDWNWRYGLYNLTDWSKVGQYVGDTVQPELAGRIANTAYWENDGRSYAHWAVSGSAAFPDGNPRTGEASNEARFRTRPEARSLARWINTDRIDGASHYQLVGLEGVWNEGPLQLTGEYMNTWVGRDGGSDLSFNGGYLYLSYFLTGEYMPWSRKSGTLGRPKPSNNLGSSSGAWQVGLRYSFADFTDDDILGGVGESLTFGLNWYWNPNASLQLNYIRGDISERSVDSGGSTFTEGDYEIVGLRMRVDF